MSTERTSNSRNDLIGSCFVAVSVLLFACNNTLMKLCETRGLKVSQMLFGRFCLQCVIALSYWKLKKPASCTHWYGDAPHVVNIWARGMCYSVAVASSFYAYCVLPIGDCGTITSQAPLVTGVLAYFLLGETLPKMTPVVLSFAFAGIVCICQPSFIFDSGELATEPLRWDGLLACLVAMTTLSVSSFLVRTAQSAHFLQQEIVCSLQVTMVLVPIMVVINSFTLQIDLLGSIDLVDEWQFDWQSLLMVAAMAVIGFTALCLYVVGYQYAEATRVAWMEYANLVYLFAFQILVFNHMPNLLEIIGVVLVLTACATSVMEQMYNIRMRKPEEVIQIESQKADHIESENSPLLPVVRIESTN